MDRACLETISDSWEGTSPPCLLIEPSSTQKAEHPAEKIAFSHHGRAGASVAQIPKLVISEKLGITGKRRIEKKKDME